MQSQEKPLQSSVKALRIDEAAKALNVSHWTVRRLIKSGAIKSCRKLRVHLIPIEEIDRFLESSN